MKMSRNNNAMLIESNNLNDKENHLVQSPGGQTFGRQSLDNLGRNDGNTLQGRGEDQTQGERFKDN